MFSPFQTRVCLRICLKLSRKFSFICLKALCLQRKLRVLEENQLLWRKFVTLSREIYISPKSWLNILFMNTEEVLSMLQKIKSKSEDIRESQNLSTAKNTVISPNFLVWKFCGKTQFPYSFGRTIRNYAETVPFHKIFTSGS